MTQRYNIYILFLMVLSILIGGCSEDDKTNQVGKDIDGRIRISVKIPTESIPKNTSLRSAQTNAESQINELQVLVFEDDLYSYKTRGEDITQSENSAVFHARLRSSEVATTIFIVANSNAIVDANEPPEGTPIDQVRTLFSIGFASSGTLGNVAFWGSYTLHSGINGAVQNELNNIGLLRTVARVDVQVAPTASNFILETLQVFRAANSIQLIPNAPNTELAVTSPSIPVGTAFNINTSPINATSASLSQGQIYLPESAPPSTANQVTQATCLVVGGRFNNSATRRYYRLDFNPQLANHPLGQILRNCRYQFNISEVTVDGYNNPLEAANNPSANMDFELVIWPGEQIGYMFFDNTSYFGLSDITAGLGGAVGYNRQIDVATNLSGYGLRFGNDGPWLQTLNNGVFSVTRTNGDQVLVITALTNNFTGNDRKQEIQIQAGNIEPINVEITQSPTQIEWATSNVSTFGTFAPQIQDAGNLYQWNRTTSFPANTSTAVGWSNTIDPALIWTVQNDPCPTGWRMPTTEEWNFFRVLYPGSSTRTNGVFYAATQAEATNATFANPGRAIFLLDAGFRSGTTGTYTATNGGYICSDRAPDGRLNVFAPIGNVQSVGASTIARAIRCVRNL